MFRSNILHQLIPVLCFLLHVFSIGVEGHHGECFAKFRIARANIGTVAASQTVEHRSFNAEVHTLHSCGSLHLDGVECVETSQFLVGENEGSDGSVRTNECTLVTLDTVVFVPNRNESLHAALLVGGCSVLPRAVNGVVLHKVRNLQQVAGLSIDGANKLFHESGSLVGLGSLVGEVCPFRVNGQLFVFATTVNGSIVHVHNVFALLAVRLHDELLHLFNGQLNGNNTGDAEESRLQDGVGAVAQSNFLCNLGGVDVIDGDVVLCEHALHLVGDEVNQFVALEDGVQQERAILLQTACNIIHVQISLHVACYKVRCCYQIGRADGRVAEAQV